MNAPSAIQAARDASPSAVRNALSTHGTEGSYKVALLHAQAYDERRRASRSI